MSNAETAKSRAAIEATPAKPIVMGRVLKTDAYNSFFDEVEEDVTLSAIPVDFSAQTNIQIKIQQLTAYFDTAVRFQIGLTEVPTISAVTSNSRNYILYNEKFYYDLLRKAGSEWGPLFVVAHEIAHHREAHLLPMQYSTARHGHSKQQGQMLIQELEADWFAGRILAKMGATKSQATEAVRSVLPAQATATHPARAARLAIIENGWDSVCTHTSSCSSKASTETDKLAIDQYHHDLSALNPKYTCRFKGQQLLINAEDEVYWMKLPGQPVGERLTSTRSEWAACSYQIAMLDKTYCVSQTKGRIVRMNATTPNANVIQAVDNKPYHADLCTPCRNGLCP